MKTCSACVVILTVFMLNGLCGCASVERSTPALADVVLSVDAGRRVWFNGEAYAIPNLAAALKAVRVAPRQPIRIQIADRKDKALLVQISSALRSAGFTRILFVSPPHAEAAVAQPGRPLKQTFEPVDPFTDAQPRAPVAPPRRNPSVPAP